LRGTSRDTISGGFFSGLRHVKAEKLDAETVVAKAKRKIDRIIEFHREWLSSTAQDVYNRAIGWLNADLAEGSLCSLNGIVSSLDHLATYYGIKGEIALLDGHADGSASVHLSAHCHLWSLRLKAAAFHRVADTPNLTQYAGRAACSLCYSIACDLNAWGKAQNALLSEMTLGSEMVNKEYWEQRCFEPFVLRLSQTMENGGRLVPADGENYDVYTRIFAGWNDSASLAEALVEACEYHCQNMEDTGDWDPEFDHPLFDLIPWEVLAITRIREVNGLAVPAIDHPLVSSPLMRLDRRPKVEDEVLARVEVLYRKLLPGE
jgi:hypothetical protein